MVILGIETSCDETAISLIDASGMLKNGVKIAVLADKTLSQIALHQQYGGVFPSMAKREHSRNLIPLFKTVLAEAGFGNPKSQIQNPSAEGGSSSGRKQSSNSKSATEKNHSQILKNLRMVLEREPELLKQFLEFIPTIQKPPTRPVKNREGSQRAPVSNWIDLIAVTEGPGLEPCLWTGLNFARALSLVWNIPVVPVNHMEGHIFSALLRKDMIHDSRFMIHEPAMPALALLISGGHTELVLVKDWFQYKIIGATRDDAVGEAFDKVARLLGLPYPGGPEISRLAEQARNENTERTQNIKLPRPMIKSGNLDFSFAGLKTAVLYLVKKLPKPLDDKTKAAIAREFENAVTDVLIAKTKRAIEKYNCKTLLIGGGVIANTQIRRSLKNLANTYDRKYLLKRRKFLHVPEPNLTTDNALMIAVAGYLRYSLKNGSTKAQNRKLAAKGNLRLDEK